MHLVCSIDDIPRGAARAFPLPNRDGVTFFIVHWGDSFHAYVNECPHMGVNLEWSENRFLNLDGSQIQCAMHGALFRIEDGYCTWGPCRGRSLKSLPLKVSDGLIYLDDRESKSP
jgi:nitrite reductase/ring-hydroxylating ferredoxin subunit